MRIERTVVRSLLAICALSLTTCSGKKVITVIGCAQDSDCGDPTLFGCNKQTGVCHCKNDGACPKGEFCNPAGDCQAHVTCYVNTDCPSQEICDFHTNVCIPQGRCTSDDQCEIGQICDLSSGTCVPGCHSFGDCPLGDSCLCTDANGKRFECSCASLDDADREQCQVGVCSTDACPNTAACPYGKLCRSSDPDAGVLPTCISDYDPNERPYCDTCVATPGQNNTCGNGPNFCLADTSNGDFGGSYCGVDCSEGQECPNGYHCADVVVVRSIGCSKDTDCPPGPLACQQDSDCGETNGLCQKQAGALTGYCSGRCYKHEGDTQGFCTCTVDNECDQDVCESSSRTCSISQRNCTLDGSGCEPIRCVPFHGLGGCFIGQNCAPNEGLDCSNVRP
jgi:hypothetical protein